MLELHILASKIESFPALHGLLNSGDEELQFTPFGGGPNRPDQTAFVLELSKATTFLSYFVYWWNFTFELT